MPARKGGAKGGSKQGGTKQPGGGRTPNSTEIPSGGRNQETGANRAPSNDSPREQKRVDDTR